MAITTIAPMSSITANVVRKTFNPKGTRLPSNCNIPKENAISVAIGIPQPCVPLSSWFSKKNNANSEDPSSYLPKPKPNENKSDYMARTTGNPGFVRSNTILNKQ